MYEKENQIKECEKYLALAEKYYKMKQNPHLKLNPPENPYEEPKPKVPKPERYTSQLTHSQSQEIRLHFVNLLVHLNLYDLVDEYLNKLEDSQKREILEIEIEVFYERYDQALGKMDLLLKKGDNIRNIDLLMMKADICYRCDKMFECEEIFLTILQLKPPVSKTVSIYLKLGYTYLNRKSWEDAKKIFEKACEHKYNCSIAWEGLGIACINLGLYEEAEEALNLTKIYNPLTKETREYEDKINEHYAVENAKVYDKTRF